MTRPAVASIDLEAFADNLRYADSLADTAETVAVVKADGYGHGIVEIARTAAHQVKRLAVSCPEEALQIRSAGVKNPIILLEGIFCADELAWCLAHDCELVLHSDYQVSALESYFRDDIRNDGVAQSATQVWLKLNTGMNRLGFDEPGLLEMKSRLGELGGCVHIQGVLSHIACADDAESQHAMAQFQRFADFRSRCSHGLSSIANSATLLNYPKHCYQLIRPGIMLYGSSPVLGRTGLELGLKPVMTLKSRVIATRKLKPGDTVGYGATWVADKECYMGVVAMGYGDGYPRHAPNGTPVAIQGRQVQLIGRVSMDMLTVDLGLMPDIGVGAEVELWGNTVSVDTVANHCQTIGYELLTGITPRVPRVYTHHST
ncbi:MAG: alanine racemase [Pseudomonadales bacterium]|nr:alanine racemase [Pseudomonadales bacterium]